MEWNVKHGMELNGIEVVSMWFRLQMLPEPVMVLLQERICSLRGANSFPITEPSHITGIRYSPIAEVENKKNT